MTSLAAATSHQWEQFPGEVNTKLIAGEAILAGQLVAYHATTPETVIDPTDDLAADFAGVATESGAAGERIEVRQVGVMVKTIAGTFAARTEGTACYGDTSGTASNNPADITHTSTNNLLIGKVTRVITAGAGAKVAMLLEADGYR